MCGRDISKRLVAEYDVSEVITLASSGNVSAFMLDGIGEVKAKAIVDWFADTEHRDLADRVMMRSDIIDDRAAVNNGSDIFKGVIFVVTGKLNNYASRDLLKEEIESLGGKVAGSVSTKTTYLINNDVNSTSGKNKDAKKYGTRIISEDDYLKLKNGEAI
jgi:DNA ligase (NAD+)